ncbi:hypothetical protein [Streptomyces murinus]|uniref:hypothetical protein n=1 Tax=Streptomyces murinus TaxID=33900 RepID=UPI003F44DF3D
MAIKRRDRVVHDSVAVDRTWREYAAGGGEWVHVTTTLGEDECDTATLVNNLALQRPSKC